MKVSLNWLKRYVDIDIPVEEFCDRMTMSGFEVEDVEAASRELEAQGLEMLEKEAVEGTSDIIVNFLRPRYSEGILFELVQTVGPIDRGEQH